MFTITIPDINNKASITTPITLIALKTGSGHLVHSKFDRGWYFIPVVISHCMHNIPLYPVAQSVGASN